MNRIVTVFATITAVLSAPTARAKPTTTDILTAICRNVEQSEAASLQALYSVTITQYPKAQRQLIKDGDSARHLAEITSDTNVMNYYVKRWMNGPRSAVRALQVESVNGETKVVGDGAGGHEGDKNRTITYARVPPRILGAAGLISDIIGQVRPGCYSVIGPEETPWGIVEQYLALSETNHRFNEGNNLGPGFISVSKALTLLAKPDSVTFDSNGQFCLLTFVIGDPPSLVYRTARLDSRQSFLPIEIHSTMQNGKTSFEAQISYREIGLADSTTLYLPDSAIGVTYLTADGKHDKMFETNLSVKKWEVIPDNGWSPLHSPVDQLPQFTANDLTLLGLSEPEVLELLAAPAKKTSK